MDLIQKKHRKYYSLSRIETESPFCWKLQENETWHVSTLEDLREEIDEILGNKDVLLVDMKNFQFLKENGLVKD